MKTLKKTLCLVLALVMVVGTLAVAASATEAKPVDNLANYTDAADAKASEHAAAIDVNVGLGIINGYSATELQIDGNLTRAQAAKIVCYLLLGEDAAEALAPASSFSDVKDTSWAAKYISYAAYNEILNGKGNNKFDPEGQLTGYEFAKILLNALGYGLDPQPVVQADGTITSKTVNKYTGSFWKTLVSVDANKIHLLDEVKDAKLDEALTRAQAMELVFKAIKLDGGDELAYKLKTEKTETDEYGRSVVVYQDANDSNKTISAAYPETPFYTAKVLEDTTLADVIKAYNDDNKLTGDDAITTELAATELKAGETVELYTTDNEVTKTIRVAYVIDKVTAVADDGKLTSTNELFNGEKIDGAAKDDVYIVPVAISNSNKLVVADAAKAEAAVTGKVSAYEKDDKNLTVSGTKYYPDTNISDVYGTASIAAMSKDFTNEYSLYVSPTGTVLAIEKKTEETTEPDYLYAFAIAYQVQKNIAAGADTTDLIGNVTKGSDGKDAVAVVSIVTPEGETKTLNLALKASSDGKKYTVANVAFFAAKEAANSGVDKTTGEITGDSKDSKSVVLEAPELVKYYLDDNGDAVIAEDTAVKNGVAYAEGAVQYDSTNLTSSTVLYVVTDTVKDDAHTYSAKSYTGYKTFPALKADDHKQVYLKNDKNVITAIYAWGKSEAPGADVVNVPAYVKSVGDVTVNGTPVTFVIDGAEVVYYAKTPAVVPTVGNFYKNVADAVTDDIFEDALTAWAVGTTRIDVANVTAVDAGYFTYADGNVEYPDTVKVIDLTGKGLTEVAAKQKLVVFSTTNDAAIASAKSLVIFITGVND